jgi:hypothetical protein
LEKVFLFATRTEKRPGGAREIGKRVNLGIEVTEKPELPCDRGA